MTNQVVNERWFQAWRKHEAYSVPVTEEGQQMAQQRAEQFEAGYQAAVKDITHHLEQTLHSKYKSDHDFYLFASRIIKEIFGN